MTDGPDSIDDEATGFVAVGDSERRSCGCYRSEQRDRDGWAAIKTLACPDHRWVDTDIVER